LEHPVAQMLSQVDQLRSLQAGCIPSRLFEVYGNELVAHFRRELAIVDSAICSGQGQLVVTVKAFLELHLVVILPVVLFAFVLCPLVPSVDVQAVSEHQHKLDHLLVVVRVHQLGALS